MFFLNHNKYIILLYFILFALLLWISVLFPIGFDDSLYALIAKNLALNGKYATNAALFDPTITTGFPVTLPLAVVFKFLSVGTLQERITPIIYFISLLTAFYFIVQELHFLSKRNTIISVILTTILYLFTVQDLPMLIFNPYGEIPSVVFYLFALLTFNRFLKTGKVKYSLITGFLLGLAISTKYLLFFAVLSTFITSLLYLNNSIKTIKFKSIFTIFITASIPELLFQTYHYITVGRENYINDILGVVGFYKAIYYKNYEFVKSDNNFHDHLKIFTDFGTPHIALIAIFIFLFIFLLLSIKRKNYIFVNLSLFTIFFYIWWFFITFNLLIRHLFIGTIILEFLISIAIVKLYIHITSEKKRKFGFAVLFILIYITIFQMSFDFFRSNLNLRGWKMGINEQKILTDFVNNNKNFHYYYSGYDQTPQVQLLADKTFYYVDEYKYKINNKTKNNYLIMSKMRLKNAPERYYSMKKKCSNIVLQTSYYFICKLVERNF